MTAVTAVALFLALTPASAQAQAANRALGSTGAGPTPTAAPLPPPKAWIVVDADTGNVVDAGSDRTPMPPASLTKVITALLASTLAPDTPVPVSDRAAAAPADSLFMKAGTVWTADELFHSLLISSANDAAIALTEKVAGSVEGFQRDATQMASRLGMTDNPVLLDPAGLDGSQGVGGGNLLSARDLAIAGRALLAVPSLAAVVATPIYYFDGPDNVHHRLTNHNKMFLTSYAGAIGMKTGYTKRAGSCLMAAAQVGGRTMLAVVMNSPNPTAQSKALLDKGFATPVSAEVTTDQLPVVNPSAFDPSATPPPRTGSGSGSSIPGTPLPRTPTPVSAVARSHGALPSGPPLVAAAGLAGLVCLALVIKPRRRRGARPRY